MDWPELVLIKSPASISDYFIDHSNHAISVPVFLDECFMSGFFVHTLLPTLAGGVAQKIGAFGSQKVRPGVLFRFFRIERVCAAGAVSRNDLSFVEAQVFDSP